VRLTGCPMRCVWCDSEYTFTGGETKTFGEILTQLEEWNCRLVEVTGGEPLAQKNAFEFITLLCDKGYEVLVETGGFVSTEKVDARAKIILDIKCPASGEAERNHWENLQHLRAEKDEVKFVIADRADWDFTVEIIRQYELEKRTRAILVSPVFAGVDLAEVAGWVAESGLKVRLNLQLHKYIWGADARGV